VIIEKKPVWWLVYIESILVSRLCEDVLVRRLLVEVPLREPTSERRSDRTLQINGSPDQRNPGLDVSYPSWFPTVRFSKIILSPP